MASLNDDEHDVVRRSRERDIHKMIRWDAIFMLAVRSREVTGNAILENIESTMEEETTIKSR